MKKVCLFVMGSVLATGSLTSAPSGHTFPDKALENYDIRSDIERDGARRAHRQIFFKEQLLRRSAQSDSYFVFGGIHSEDISCFH
jgi:hypothetical protein